MPTPYEILLLARDSASQTIKNVDGALKQLDDTAKKTSGSFSQAGERSENYGRAISRGVQIAQSSLDILAPAIGKIAPEFDSAIRAAQQFGGAMSLAFSFGGPGVAIAAITTVIGLFVSEMAKAREAAAQAHAELIKPFDDLTKSLNDLAPAADKFAAQIQAVFRVTPQVAGEMANAARASDDYRRSLELLAQAAKIEAEAEAERSRLLSMRGRGVDIQAVRAAVHELDVSTLEAIRGTRVMQVELTGVADKARELTVSAFEASRGLNALSIAAMTGAGNISTLTERLSDAAVQMREMGARTIDASEDGSLLAASLANVKFQEDQDAEATRRATEAMNAQKAAAEALKNALMGMVEKALTPTAVTEADIAATRAGKYVDKWDEFARRADAVAKGTDPSKYGNKFAEQLKGLGMTAEQAAAGFRDFSLFADPKNLNLVDWEPFVTDIKGQIKSLIGEANLMKEGFDRAWASLTPTERTGLAQALHVPAADANNMDKVFEAMSGGDAQQSEKTTSEIAANIQIISGIHTAIVDVQKSATFDATLKEILDDLAKIPASADVVVTLTYETAAAPSGGGTGPAQPPAPTGGGVPMQHGGSFVVPPGFDENYPIRLSSGEQVTVLPANMSDKDLDYFIKQNFSTLERLYNANPSYWMGVAAQHPGWGRKDWYDFIFGGQFGGFKLSDLGIPPAAGGRGAASKPGDSYHGPVYNAPVANYFNVYPRDYEDLMRQARASAAHGA